MKHADLLYRDMFATVRGIHLLAGIGASVLVVMYHAQVSSSLVYAWLTAMWLVELAQEATLRWRPTTVVPSPGRVRVYAGLNLLACAGWGSSALLFAEAGFWPQLTLGLFLYAVALLPAVLQSPIRHVYAASALLCVMPFCLRNLLYGGSDRSSADEALALLILAATGYAIHLCYAAHRRQLRALESDIEREHAQLALLQQSHRLAQTRARLDALSTRDALTGVATLEHFCEQLQPRCSGTGPVVLLALDVRDFRAVNHAFGWDAGNYALSTLAGRLAAALGDALRITRVTGAEFVVLLEAADADAQAARLLDTLRTPVAWAGGTIRLIFRCGLARYPDDADSPASLVESALLAMRDARDDHRPNRFHRERQHSLRSDSAMRWDLAHGLERGEFELHFQPKLRLRDGRFAGAEALLRWNHPTLGRVTPDRFIGIGESSGLIVPIGDWVLDQAVRAAARLPLPEGGHVAVNVSPRELAGNRLPRRVARALQRHGAVPSRLQVELTESAIMGDPGRVCEQLHELRRMGVSVALDDFGTGHSSLRYLRDLPIDTLKLDRSFIQDLQASPRHATITASVLRLAHELGLEVVVEGIETLAQHAWLLEHGCDIGQGYLFARPMGETALRGWLQRRDAA